MLNFELKQRYTMIRNLYYGASLDNSHENSTTRKVYLTQRGTAFFQRNERTLDIDFSAMPYTRAADVLRRYIIDKLHTRNNRTKNPRMTFEKLAIANELVQLYKNYHKDEMDLTAEDRERLVDLHERACRLQSMSQNGTEYPAGKLGHIIIGLRLEQDIAFRDNYCFDTNLTLIDDSPLYRGIDFG